METHKFHRKSYNDSLATASTPKYFIRHHVLILIFLTKNQFVKLAHFSNIEWSSNHKSDRLWIEWPVINSWQEQKSSSSPNLGMSVVLWSHNNHVTFAHHIRHQNIIWRGGRGLQRTNKPSEPTDSASLKSKLTIGPSSKNVKFNSIGF
jgi:hypothetical protein